MKVKSNSNALFSTFATNVFIQVCTVIQGILMARILGPSGRGEYAAVILWPSLFAGLGILGINMVIARRAGKTLNPESLVGAAVVLAIFTGTSTALLCGILLKYLIPATLHNILPTAYLFLFYIPLNHIVLNLCGIDQGTGNFKLYNLCRVILYPSFLIGLIFCWFWTTDKVFSIVVALLLSNVAALGVHIFGRSGYVHHRTSFAVNGIFKESLPFLGASILTILYQQCDKTLLVWLLSPQEIGYYVVAFSAGTVLNALNQALGTVAFTRAANRPPGTGFPEVAQSIRRASILSFFGILALSCALPYLLPLIYGAPFKQAVHISLILLPAVTLASLADILNQDLRGQGKPIAGVAARILGLVAIAGVGWSLAGLFGAAGIACGVIAGETISFVGLLFVALRFYKDANITDLVPGKDDLLFFWQKFLNMRRAY